MSLKWYGKELTAHVEQIVERNLDRAAEFLKSEIQRSMRQGGGKANAERTGKRRGKKRGRIPRSQPGQVPFVQTGRLRQSIFARVKIGGKLVRQVGTNLSYGIALELGTRPFTVRVRNKKVLANVATGEIFGKQVTVQIKPRPFIRPAFERNKRKIARILATGL